MKLSEREVLLGSLFYSVLFSVQISISSAYGTAI